MLRFRCLCAILILGMLAGCAPQPQLKDTVLQESTQESVVETKPADVTDPTTESTTQPTEATTEPTTVPTEPPTQPTEPSVAPTEPAQEGYIGSYTRAELAKLNRTNNGYGPGTQKDEKGRPYGAMQLNAKYQKYDAWFVGPDDGCIYLTFDLGWENNGLTNDILDTLKEKNVKAVFFVLHEYVRDNPEIVRRVIDEGHMLASHAYHHKTLAELSLDEIAEELTMLHDEIREKFGYEMTLFRPPSGEFSEQVLGVAHALGYRTVNWSYAYVDWLADDQPDVQKSYNKLMNAAHSGCIYLLHTVSTTNAALMGDLIDGLRQEGYRLELFTQETQ